jgi:site-specific recombinase XerD
MLEHFFTDPDDVDRFRRGVLSDTLDDVATFLQDRGYSPAVARSYLLIAGHFSHWLALEGIAPTELQGDTIARFRDEHLPLCRCRGPRGMRSHVNAALRHVLDAIKQRGRDAPSSVSMQCPVDQILRAFDTHLDHTCGAAPATRRLYTRYARGLLDSRFGTGEVNLSALNPRQLIEFISEQTRERSPETARIIRTALRSLFRFAQLEGLCDGTLAAAVPRVARWKRARLPRALSDQQLASLLNTFDHSTVIGRRDYAITLCLAQLGLRAGEVANLTLDDIDWRSSTLRLARVKERRASILPMPAPLAHALVSYLRRGRPPRRKRQLFVRNRAPFGEPLTSDAVRAVVRRAFARAGLDVAFQGAHVLRHTAATRMVRAGSSLKEVADVLRHHSLETVMIYTKLDLSTLAAVAQAWPEVQS